MDFKLGEKEIRLREEIREFVKQELPPEYAGFFAEEQGEEGWRFSMQMAQKLSKKGWLTINWPKEYGGMGATRWEQAVYAEEVGYWGIPGTQMGVSGVGWVGPSLMMFGNDEQKKKYLPLIAAGDPDGVWCTGYSEPNAGSDFANLRTEAVRKGDIFVVNGQKVWTSSAHHARYGWFAVRTQPNPKKKHHGISVLIIDMKAPGVTIRPIKNLVGIHHFNEVFLEDVEVPVDNLVGQENQGWSQLMHSLGQERGSVVINAYGGYKRLFDEIVQLAKDTGLIKRAENRKKLADLAIDLQALRLLALESIYKLSIGVIPIHEPSRDKAYSDLIFQKLATVGTEILGVYSQLDPLYRNTKWTRIQASIENSYWLFPGMLIAAGTTLTQKNIVGQFGLELPRSY